MGRQHIEYYKICFLTNVCILMNLTKIMDIFHMLSHLNVQNFIDNERISVCLQANKLLACY